MRRTLGLLLVVTLVALAVSACGGGDVAEKPKQDGENGKISFVRLIGSSGTIYEMNADGTGVTNVTDPSLYIESAATSPSGDKIAFTSPSNRGVRLYVMNADGARLRRLTNNSEGLFGSFVFSPDGKKIAFMRWANDRDIYVINVDGTGLRHLTNMDGDESNPVWSRNGRKISFINTRDPIADSQDDIGISKPYVMNADGTRITKVSTTWASVEVRFLGLASSPDCKKIAFVRDNGKDYNEEDYNIYVRHADGQEIQATHNPAAYGHLVFSPGCKKIAFTSTLASSPDSPIYVIAADGTGRETHLTKGEYDIPIGWRSE